MVPWCERVAAVAVVRGPTLGELEEGLRRAELERQTLAAQVESERLRIELRRLQALSSEVVLRVEDSPVRKAERSPLLVCVSDSPPVREFVDVGCQVRPPPRVWDCAGDEREFDTARDTIRAQKMLKKNREERARMGLDRLTPAVEIPVFGPVVAFERELEEGEHGPIPEDLVELIVNRPPLFELPGLRHVVNSLPK